MDKNHAKFILQSYRPDGADAGDPDFQEALQLAAEDRELGQWLAQERAHDVIFVEALGEVNIPESLRDEIFAMIEHGGSEVDMSSEMDALFASAISQQTPPPGLRDQILSAMEVERKATQKVEVKKILQFPTRWMNVAAVAAVALLGFAFIYPELSKSGDADQTGIAQSDPSDVENVVEDSIVVQPEVLDIEQQRITKIFMDSGRILNASYEVDMPSESFSDVNTWLEKEGMPVAKSVPEALISYDVKGGRKVTYENGMQGSLILFNNDNAEKYYLMVIDLNSVKDSDSIKSLSEVKLKKCYGCPITKFNATTWKDKSEAYILLTKAEQEQMLELF